jgi:hypothetical protein
MRLRDLAGIQYTLVAVVVSLFTSGTAPEE